MKKFLMATTLMLNLSPLFAANYLFIAGGGGEPMKDPEGNPNPKTIFDENLQTMANLKATAGYKTRITFNGGHSNTESIIARNFKPEEIAGRTFDKKSFFDTIKDYETKIKNGEIKKGDQLLIYIDSHGGTKKPNEETHEISLGKSPLQNYESLGNDAVSLDQLKTLTKIANDKGIKLGIIDLSCHSGNTLALKNENTCIISSAGPDHYGYGGNSQTFSSRFLNAMTKGRSLEEAYLDVRGQFQDTSFPMISSPVGADVQSELYPLAGPYLYYFDTHANKLRGHIEETATKEEMCRDEESFKQLKKIIEQIQDISQFSKMSLKPVQAEVLKRNLETYYNYQKSIKETLIAGGKEYLSRKENFCKPYMETLKSGKKVSKKSCLNYSWEQLVTIDYDAIIRYWAKELKRVKGNELSESLATLEVIKIAKVRSEEIKKQYPSLKDLKKIYDQLDNKEQKSINLAYDIAKDMQSLYVDLYKLKSNNDTRPNPCKDFKI